MSTKLLESHLPFEIRLDITDEQTLVVARFCAMDRAQDYCDYVEASGDHGYYIVDTRLVKDAAQEQLTSQPTSSFQEDDINKLSNKFKFAILVAIVAFCLWNAIWGFSVWLAAQFAQL